MATVKPNIFTIKDFRALPEVRPSLEFFGGRVIQKMSPTWPHGIIQIELGAYLIAFARPGRLGRAVTELRCTFGGSSYVFDLCFFVRNRLPDPTSPVDREEVSTPPDLAVEILSPGQTVGELSRKLRSAIRRGVRLGWLIDEARRNVHVFHPAKKPQVLRAGDVLSGGEVLPGFALAIDELFGWVGGN